LNAENAKKSSINPNSTAVVVNSVGGNLAANLTSKFLNITHENRD
jgi:acetyl esterase/lipase